MKRLVAVAAALLFLPLVASAQAVSGGIKVGANFSDIPRLGEAIEREGAAVERAARLIVGAHATIRLNNWIEFQPEALYTRKGLNWVYPREGVSTLELDYVDVPLLITLTSRSGRGLFVLAGPSVNFNIRARVKNDATDFDFKDNIEEVEFGLVAGAGVRTAHFVVEGRWMEGLTNTYKEAARSYQNRGVAVLAGVRFP